MPVVTTKVGNTGREFAKPNDLFATLSGWQVHITKRAYSLTYNVGIAPTMVALQSAHDLSRVAIKSGVYYVIHVYNYNKVYRRVNQSR